MECVTTLLRSKPCAAATLFSCTGASMSAHALLDHICWSPDVAVAVLLGHTLPPCPLKTHLCAADNL
jgi:hypothetical protein